jgi:hypothetical protein
VATSIALIATFGGPAGWAIAGTFVMLEAVYGDSLYNWIEN